MRNSCRISVNIPPVRDCCTNSKQADYWWGWVSYATWSICQWCSTRLLNLYCWQTGDTTILHYVVCSSQDWPWFITHKRRSTAILEWSFQVGHHRNCCIDRGAYMYICTINMSSHNTSIYWCGVVTTRLYISHMRILVASKYPHEPYFK